MYVHIYIYLYLYVHVYLYCITTMPHSILLASSHWIPTVAAPSQADDFDDAVLPFWRHQLARVTRPEAISMA